MKKPSTGCNTPYQRRAWGWNVYQQTGLLTSVGASLGAFVGSAVGSWVGLLVGSYDEEKEVDTFCEPENSRICRRTCMPWSVHSPDCMAYLAVEYLYVPRNLTFVGASVGAFVGSAVGSAVGLFVGSCK